MTENWLTVKTGHSMETTYGQYSNLNWHLANIQKYSIRLSWKKWNQEAVKNPVNVSTMVKALTDGSHGVGKGPSHLIPEPLHSDGYCLFGKHLVGFKVHLPDDPATMLFKSQLCQPLGLGKKNRQVARKFHCSFMKKFKWRNSFLLSYL